MVSGDSFNLAAIEKDVTASIKLPAGSLAESEA